MHLYCSYALLNSQLYVSLLSVFRLLYYSISRPCEILFVPTMHDQTSWIMHKHLCLIKLCCSSCQCPWNNTSAASLVWDGYEIKNTSYFSFSRKQNHFLLNKHRCMLSTKVMLPNSVLLDFHLFKFLHDMVVAVVVIILDICLLSVYILSPLSLCLDFMIVKGLHEAWKVL